MDFETPTADLSVEDLKLRYGISKQTLYNRINAAGVAGKRVKGKTFFTPPEVWSLDQVAGFVERGTSLNEVTRLVQEYKEKQAVEPDLQPSEPEPDLRAVSGPAPGPTNVTVPPAPGRNYEAEASATALATFTEREEQARVLAGALTLAVGKALQDTKEVVSDPLWTHRLLAEAAREEWVLTGSQLAEICGVNGSTVTGWRPHTVRCGFWLEAATQGLWTVRKATRDELLEHAAAHARPVPRGGQKKQQPE